MHEKNFFKCVKCPEILKYHVIDAQNNKDLRYYVMLEIHMVNITLSRHCKMEKFKILQILMLFEIFL